MIERLSAPGLPEPRGPYSPAVRAGDFVFVSGQVPVNPATQQVELSEIRAETRLTLSNIKLILEAAGSSMKDVVKCSVFLADVGDFQAMNEIYTEFFGDAKPARTTVGCTFALPGLHVEIDCIAFSPLAKK